MSLMKIEQKEWTSLKRKSKIHGIPIFRNGANAVFDKDVYAQLGNGRASEIMNARIRLKKKRLY